METTLTPSGFIRPAFNSNKEKWSWHSAVRKKYFMETAPPKGSHWQLAGNLEGRVASASGDQPLRTIGSIDYLRRGKWPVPGYYPSVNLTPYSVVPLALRRQSTLGAAITAANHALFHKAKMPIEQLPLFPDLLAGASGGDFYSMLTSIPWHKVKFRWDAPYQFSALIPCPETSVNGRHIRWEPYWVALFRIEAIGEELWALVPCDPIGAPAHHAERLKSLFVAEDADLLVEHGYLLSTDLEALQALVLEWALGACALGHRAGIRADKLVPLVWTHLQWTQRFATLQELENPNRPDFYEDSTP